MPGKGAYWTMHPKAIAMFENGSLLRRRKRFRLEEEEKDILGSELTALNNLNTFLASRPQPQPQPLPLQPYRVPAFPMQIPQPSLPFIPFYPLPIHHPYYAPEPVSPPVSPEPALMTQEPLCLVTTKKKNPFSIDSILGVKEEVVNTPPSTPSPTPSDTCSSTGIPSPHMLSTPLWY